VRARVREFHERRFHAPPPDATLISDAAALDDPAVLFEALTAHAGALLFADDIAGCEAAARRALAMYQADPTVAVTGAAPDLPHLYNRLHVVTDWGGQLRDAYRFSAEALIAAGPQAGQGVLLADVFGSEVALGVVGRATELYAATGWRAAFHAPGGRWAEVSIARLLAVEGKAREAAEWLLELVNEPESTELPDVLRWQLAEWAGLYGVEEGDWDVAARARARQHEMGGGTHPRPRPRQQQSYDVLCAEIAYASGDIAEARRLLRRLAEADDPYNAVVHARAALLRATDELAQQRPQAALAALADAARRFDVITAQLRPRYCRLRREALAATGDYQALAADLADEIDELDRPRRKPPAVDVLGDELAARLDLVFDEFQAMLVGHLHWERGEVAEAISHDLAGALSIVRLSLDLPDSSRDRMIGALDAATQRMRAIVDSLALLVSIERSRLRPALSAHPFTALVERAVANVRPLADAKQMPIEFTGSVDGSQVLADLGFFEMSLSNVLVNAVKYAQPGNPIEVRVYRAGSDMVAVSVSDHGPGLTGDELESVFQRHVRGRAQPTGGEPSLGLGLYISREMCELMGGRVWAESPGLGAGATFTLALPELSSVGAGRSGAP
jgi:signal transduction histidine kinase